jgi:uncharacterized protein YqgC (DUF456 family)
MVVLPPKVNTKLPFRQIFFYFYQVETLLFILAALCAIAGLAGCILPALPGPPIAYVGMLLMQWAIKPYSTTLLIVTAVITIAVLIFDFYLPILTAKKYGATKQGIRGSIIGMVLGIFLTPIGMIAGLIIGAVVGDIIAGRTITQSTRSATGTVVGTLITIGVKLAWTVILCWYIFSRMFSHAFPHFSIFG